MPCSRNASMSSFGMMPPPVMRTSSRPASIRSARTRGKSVMCAPERIERPTTSTSSWTAAVAIISGVWCSPVYTTSMPASRSAAATTLAPRSCPSRPGLATSTRMGRARWRGRGAVLIIGLGSGAGPAGGQLPRSQQGIDELGHGARAGDAGDAARRGDADERRVEAGSPRAHHVHLIDVTNVQRSRRLHAQPVERRPEDTGVGLLDARDARVDNHVEVAGQPGGIERLLDPAVAVRDDAEPYARVPEPGERTAGAGVPPAPEV